MWVRLDSSQALAWLTSTKCCLRLWRFLLLFTWLLVFPKNSESKVYQKEEVTSMLKANEGSKYNDSGQMISYVDSRGYLTAGYGHKILDGDLDFNGDPITKKGQVISTKQADDWFDSDSSFAMEFAESIPMFDKMSKARQEVMIDLTFNMGRGWVKEFTNLYMLATNAPKYSDSRQHDNLWKAAAGELRYKDPRSINMINSDYWGQVGNRAVRNYNKLLKGG